MRRASGRGNGGRGGRQLGSLPALSVLGGVYGGAWCFTVVLILDRV